jgi:hypothetical protein
MKFRKQSLHFILILIFFLERFGNRKGVFLLVTYPAYFFSCDRWLNPKVSPAFHNDCKTVERFQQDLSVVNKHDVKGIVDSVFGKSDSTKTYLTMWDDEECQEFSPTRAIFLWLKSPV